jgi:hypothetical protein
MLNWLNRWRRDNPTLVRVVGGVLATLMVVALLSPRGFLVAVLVLFLGVVFILILFALPFGLFAWVAGRVRQRNAEVPSDE